MYDCCVADMAAVTRHRREDTQAAGASVAGILAAEGPVVETLAVAVADILAVADLKVVLAAARRWKVWPQDRGFGLFEVELEVFGGLGESGDYVTLMQATSEELDHLRCQRRLRRRTMGRLFGVVGEESVVVAHAEMIHSDVETPIEVVVQIEVLHMLDDDIGAVLGLEPYVLILLSPQFRRPSLHRDLRTHRIEHCLALDCD